MTFPFGDKPPLKDVKRIKFDFLTLKTKEDVNKFLDYMTYYEGCRDIFKMRDNEEVCLRYAISLVDEPFKSLSYVSIYVMAEQTYHGARMFHDLDAFITYRQEQMMN